MDESGKDGATFLKSLTAPTQHNEPTQSASKGEVHHRLESTGSNLASALEKNDPDAVQWHSLRLPSEVKRRCKQSIR